MTLTPRIDIDGYRPAHLSHSSVSGYASCGMRFKLQKVLRKEQLPGLAGIGGNAVHAATEWLDLAEFFGNDLDLEKIEEGKW